jgi:hypothetical protein
MLVKIESDVSLALSARLILQFMIRLATFCNGAGVTARDIIPGRQANWLQNQAPTA